jgi:hypothetical protein
MTVGAADLAFGQFSRNRQPWIAASGKERHRLPFARSINMIELENHEVALAAVDTRVSK